MANIGRSKIVVEIVRPDVAIARIFVRIRGIGPAWRLLFGRALCRDRRAAPPSLAEGAESEFRFAEGHADSLDSISPGPVYHRAGVFLLVSWLFEIPPLRWGAVAVQAFPWASDVCEGKEQFGLEAG